MMDNLTNFQKRVVSALVMGAIGVGCILAGGQFFFTLLAVLCGFCLYEVWKFPLDKPWKAAALVYVLVGFSGAYSMHQNFGVSVFLFIAAIVVLTDVGGYFAGKLIGGPKMAPDISPGKTWAGCAGGIALSLIAVLIPVAMNGAYFIGSNAMWVLLIVAVMLSIVTQTGDLFESWLKRKAGIKDSSNLIPGHGGFFDRLDGWIAAFALSSLIDLVGRFL